MDLWITDRDNPGTLGDVSMTINDFIDIRNHPFIVSRKFSTCHVQIDKRIPTDLFSELVKFVRVIPIDEEIELTKETLPIVSKIYPNRAALIRHAYYSDKESANKLVNGLIKESNSNG